MCFISKLISSVTVTMFVSIMNYLKLCILFCVIVVNLGTEDTDFLLDDLFNEIKTALNAGGALDENQTRQHQNLYRPQNNGISLGVYEALRSIAKNDELECIPRLLCEAAAGGQPGSSGKQIKFDKISLTNLMSYLRLDPGSSSPLLIFGRAALLGVSNRGDPYSCIINYPKCPKDQSRLLYYLNNHRGGFFQYFDKKYHKPGDYYYQNQYRPGYHYQNYQRPYKRNQIQFDSSNSLYDKFSKKGTNDIYANKYGHSSLSFPGKFNKEYNKRMVFPKERSESSGIDPRILTKYGRRPTDESNFIFSNTNRFPKQLGDSNFFPQKENAFREPAGFVTDRLPSKFYFPEAGEDFKKYPNQLTSFSSNSFFPVT